jgi:hypothetical protein
LTLTSFTDLLSALEHGSPIVQALFHPSNPSQISGLLSRLTPHKWSGSHAEGTESGHDEKYLSPPSGVIADDFSGLPPKTRFSMTFLTHDGKTQTIVGERAAFSGKGATIEFNGTPVGDPETNEIAYKDHLASRSIEVDFIWLDGAGRKQRYRFDAYF